ncbi:hypothetical protein ACIGXI_32095 [Kitasatospora aureofaciens]|uniref:hypothetical protein n=1 Tax=Kitasatospora aureofaciens TaxID=1894 RepID=UPI0037CACBA4
MSLDPAGCGSVQGLAAAEADHAPGAPAEAALHLEADLRAARTHRYDEGEAAALAALRALPGGARAGPAAFRP